MLGVWWEGGAPGSQGPIGHGGDLEKPPNRCSIGPKVALEVHLSPRLENPVPTLTAGDSQGLPSGMQGEEGEEFVLL